MNILDKKGLAALDTVKDMPSQKSREIAALILGDQCSDNKLECFCFCFLVIMIQFPVLIL